MIYLVRHAKPLYDQKILGQTDPPLDPSVRWLRIQEDYFPSTAKIISSPLKRAKQTARIFGYDEPTLDDRIMEMDLGEYQGMNASTENLRKVYQLQKKPKYKKHGGESFNEFTSRLKSFWDTNAGEELVVFCHSGVIRTILTVLLKLTSREFILDYLNIVELNVETSEFETKAIKLRVQ